MSIQVQSLYLATNLEGLNARALNKQPLIADASPKLLAAIAQTLFEEARKAEGWERDEEKAYVLFLRYLSTVIQVKNASVNLSPSEKKYCDEILEQNRSKISEVTGHVERLRNNLKKRYDNMNAKPSLSSSSSSSTNTAPNTTDSYKDTSSSTSSTKKTSLENNSVTPSFDRNLKPSKKNSVPDQQQQQQKQQQDISQASSQKNMSSCVWCETPFESDAPYFLSSDCQDIICRTCYNCTMGSPSTSSPSTPQVINFNIHNSNVTVVENSGTPAASTSNSDNWSTFFNDNFTNYCNIGASGSDNYPAMSGNDFEKLKRRTPTSAWDPVDIPSPSVKESSPSTTATSECVICFDNQVDNIFIPCGHASLCSMCSEEYKKSKGSNLECLICRTPSTGIYKVYKV